MPAARAVMLAAAGLLLIGGVGVALTLRGGPGDPSPAASPITRPAVADGPAEQTSWQAIAEPSLEVLWRAGQGPRGAVYNGSAPKTAQAFDAIERLGVKTIISVDGAAPDARAARARGIRYVHVPIGYDGLSDDDRLRIAAAISELPGPAYVHCHHGKHRSPAAVAAALVTLGSIDTDRAARLLEFAGTSEAYPGLWRAVADASTVGRPAIESIDLEALPEVSEVSGHVDAMAEIDRAFDHLRLIARAGWVVPSSHPDVVPAAEAARIAEHLRGLIDHEETAAYPTVYRGRMREAYANAAALERALADGDTERARGAFSLLRQDCTACHAEHRDR